jgi:hypothetical protein
MLHEINPGLWEELDQEIDVAIRSHLAACRRTEHGQFLHLVATADIGDLGFRRSTLTPLHPWPSW